MALMVLAAACSPQAAAPPHAANPNRYIYVTSENLSEQCYRDLGPISLTEPFAQASVEASDTTMANRLRALALKQYPDGADAVIGVHADDNDAGTMETVNGEAVQVVDHTTVACAIRDVPPEADSAAKAAAGGIVGTLIGGLTTGSPQAAEEGGWMGAAAAGSYSIIAHQSDVEQKDQDIRDALAQQRQTITSLQDERARLNECKEEETPLAQCEANSADSDKTASPDKSDEPDWNASQFDLEKQVQMQQDYIAKLQDQIGDLKTQMRNQ
jgi:hypothetical protein